MKHLFIFILLAALSPAMVKASDFKNNIACTITESLGSSFDGKNYSEESATIHKFQWNEIDDIVDSADFQPKLFKDATLVFAMGPGLVGEAHGLSSMLILIDSLENTSASDFLNLKADANGVIPSGSWKKGFTRQNKDRLEIDCTIN